MIRNQVEELNIRNDGGSKNHTVFSGLKINVILIFVVCVGEKQIQSLKEQIHRCHMEEMMVKLKVEQMKKLTHNECEKVFSLAQQREELTLVRFEIYYESIYNIIISKTKSRGMKIYPFIPILNRNFNFGSNTFYLLCSIFISRCLIKK